MKKVTSSFILISSLAFLAACGPSAEEQAQKDKMRQDSIRQAEVADSLSKVEQAKMDSIAAADMARQDSIAAAEASAANSPKKSSTPKSNKPKEEKKSVEEQTKDKMNTRRGTTVPTTPEEKKAVEETQKKMEGRRK